jgi:hypothetical protein
MSIDNHGTRINITSAGAASEHAPFEIFDTTQPQVYWNGVQKTLLTHYTVTLDLDPDDGFTVTWVTPPANGTVVTIARQTIPQRLSDYQQNGAFVSDVVNDDFDLAIYLIQELKEQFNRTLQLPITTTLTGNLEIPDLAGNGDKLVKVKTDATGFEYVTITSQGLIGDATTLTKGIVELATNAEALALASTTVVITPSNLNALVASTSQRGIIAVASPAEVTAGTDNTKAITPQALATSGFTAGDPLFQYLYFGS